MRQGTFKSPVAIYSVSLALLTTAIGLRFILDPFLGDRFPFLTLFGAVVLAAWWGGRGPALLALFAGAPAAAFFFVQPRYSLAIDHIEYQVGLVMYFAVGFVSIILFESLRREQKRTERKQQQLAEEITTRRVAEQILSEREELLRVTLTSIGDAVLATDKQGRVTFLNVMAEQLTGWSDEEARDQPLQRVFRIVAEGSRQPIENPVERALDAGRSRKLQKLIILISKHGKEHSIEDSAAPIRDKRGDIVGCVLVFRDVSERRVAELAKERIMATLENMTDGFLQLDHAWRIIYMNREFEKQCRRPRADQIGKVFWDQWPAALGTLVETENRRAVVERAVIQFENYYAPFDRWFDLKATPMPDGSLSVFCRDITERKREQEALQRSERRLRRVFESNVVGMIRWDLDRSLILDANAEFLRMTGYTREDIDAGQLNFRSLTPAEWTDRNEQGIRIIREHGFAAPYEKEYFRKDGSRMPLIIAGTRFEDSPSEGMSVIVDLTEQKRTEQELRRSELKYRQLFENIAEEVHFWHLVRDQQGRIVTWKLVDANPAAMRTWRQNLDEIRGKTTDEIFGPGSTEHYRPMVEKIMSENAPYSFEDYFPNLDMHFRFTSVPLGEYFITTGADISAIKKAYGERQLLASIVENSPEFIGISDCSGKIVYVNRAAMKLAGLQDLEQVRQTALPDFSTPKQRHFVEELVVPAAQKDGRWTGELTFRNFTTGTETPVLYDLFRVDDPANGKPMNFVAVARDITERKLAEQRTAKLTAESDRERRLFETVLSATPDFLYTFDLQGRFTYANQALLQLWQKTSAEAIGKTFFELGYPHELARILHEHIERVIQTRNPIRDDSVYTSSLGERQYEHIFVPVIGNSGEVEAVAGSTRDITERKHVQDSLYAAAERFRSLVTASAQIVWETDADGITVTDCPTWRAFTGQSMEQWVGTGWLDAIHHADREQTAHVWAQAVKSKTLYETEYRLRRADGVYRWTAVRGAPVLDKDGNVREWVGMSIDITDRKEAEEALRLRVDEIQTILDTIPVALFVTYDPSCRQMTGNRAAYELLRMRPGANLSKSAPLTERPMHFRATRNGIEIPANQLPIQRAVRGELSRNEWIDIEFEDGSRIQTIMAGTPLHDTQGRVRGSLATALDVTELRRAEEVVRRQTTKINRLVESNIIGIGFGNNDRFTEANDALLTMLGYTREDVEAERLQWRAMTPSEYEEDDKRAEEELRSRGVCTPFQKEYYRQDRSRIPVLLGVALLDSASFSWVCFVQDMTLIKKAEIELREADRKKDEFLATLAHELRNPLAPIRTGLQLIQLADGQTATIERTRTVMERQLGQLVRLVDDLMDVSRINNGKIELRKERIELTAVIQSAIETSRPLIEEMGHQLIISIPERPIVVHADLTRLAQVFLNLLNNAAKYSERGGRIWLTVARQAGDVLVSVRDSGIGIAADHLPRIFDMFSQVDRSLEKSRGGLGIGLSLVKKLVGKHGGRVEVQSAGPGQGSEFTVRLPVVEAPTDQELSAHRNSLPGSAHCILIVDDNHDGADSLALMLRIMGNETRTAYDGQEALAIAESFRPNVILLDIGLPKLNGYEACRRIRQEPWGQNIALIALTGWGQDEDRRRSQEAGFDHHLVKPVDPQALMNLLASLKGKA